jgi:hypothetical protein
MDEAGEPVFFLSGLVDGKPVNLRAGEESYFMETYTGMNASGVFEFAGKLRPTCSNCNSPTLDIRVSAYKTHDSSGYDAQLVLGTGTYGLQPLFERSQDITVLFKGEPEKGTAASHFWDFGDGTNSTDRNPRKTFLPGKYLVTYTATDAGGCNATVTNILNLQPNLTDRYNLGFACTYTGVNQVQLHVDPIYTNIMWDLGDGNFSTSHTTTIDVSTGLRKITLMRFVDTDTVKYSRNIVPQSFAGCNANMSYYCSREFNTNGLNMATITWTSETGKVFTTEGVDQPDKNLRILSSSDYITNASGQRTKKIDLEFDCRLTDGTTIIEMKNMRGVFALAFP